jgi:hypothetical protein
MVLANGSPTVFCGSQASPKGERFCRQNGIAAKDSVLLTTVPKIKYKILILCVFTILGEISHEKFGLGSPHDLRSEGRRGSQFLRSETVYKIANFQKIALRNGETPQIATGRWKHGSP